MNIPRTYICPVGRSCMLLWWIETESFVDYHRMFFSTLFHANNIFTVKTSSKSRLRENVEIEMLQMLFITFSSFQNTCMGQLLLMPWVFDLLFYRGCLCDLQKRVLNPKLCLDAHSDFQIWLFPLFMFKRTSEKCSGVTGSTATPSRNWNRSYKKILNISRPRIDACGIQ